LSYGKFPYRFGVPEVKRPGATKKNRREKSGHVSSNWSEGHRSRAG